MKQPKTPEDAVSYNPAFQVLCWDVETPDGVVSVSTEKRAIELAERSWPQFTTSRGK